MTTPQGGRGSAGRALAVDADWAQTNPATGLDPAKVRRRLEELGPNEFPSPAREQWGVRLLRQFREPMAVLLLVAAAVSGFGLGERLDASAIVVIVLLKRRQVN
jgi:magnesium-transporting ATPase (P-type)